MSTSKTKKTKKKVNESTSGNKYDIFDDFEDILMFYIVHKGRKMYFEFPLLVDRSYMLGAIKSRIALNRGFSLGWLSSGTNPTSEKLTGKSMIKCSTTYDVCIHSTNISAERLSQFHGETFYVLPTNSRK